jgi:hypothetical protein
LQPSGSHLANDFDDALQVSQHLFIGEAQHGVMLRFKPLVPSLVGSLTGLKTVTFAVDLDNNSGGVTDKIGNKILHWHLAAKGQTIDVMCFEIAPQQRLGTSHCLPKLLSASPLMLTDLRVRHLHALI